MKYLILISSILLLSLVSSIYAGETKPYEINIGTNELSWIVINNVSNITPKIDIINSSFINLTIPSNMEPCNCSMIFLKNDKIVQTIEVSTGNGGGGSRSKTKIVNQTIEKEVDNYITEYVENKTIEYVNNTITKWNTIKEPTKWTWVLAGGTLLIVTIFLYFAYRLSNKYNEKEVEDYGRN